MKKISNETYILTAVLGLSMGILSGCSSQTGWSFGIGVYPITAVSQQQQLKPGAAQVRTVKYREQLPADPD